MRDALIRLYARFPILVHGMELALIAFLLAVPGLGILTRFTGSTLFSGIGDSSVILLMGLAVLTRVTRRRAWFLLLAMTWVVLWCYGSYRAISYPVLNDIRQDIAPHIFGVRVMIPMQVMGWQGALLFLVPFLIGIYCARMTFRLWKFCAGFVGGYVATRAILWPGDLSLAAFYPVAYELITAMIVLALPLQRRALERLTGCSLYPEENAPARPRGDFLGRALGHVALLALFSAVTFYAVIGFYYRDIWRTVRKGPSPDYHSPAMRDAADVLSPLFTRNVSPAIPSTEKTLSSLYNSMSDPTPPDAAEAVWKKTNEKKVEKALTDMGPYFRAFEQAADDDYCSLFTKGISHMPDFVNLRETARSLDVRAMLRMHENRSADAIHDIETLFRFGRLMGADGTLVNQMIGMAIRGFGLDVATSFYLRYRDDPEALRLLNRCLERNRDAIRFDLPVDTLRRTEPALRPVSLMAEIAMPGFASVPRVFYSKWVLYDELRIALALERYRTAKGSFPPDLKALVPDDLPRLPVDPFRGKPYVYENKGSTFALKPLKPARLTPKMLWSNTPVFNPEGFGTPATPNSPSPKTAGKAPPGGNAPGQKNALSGRTKAAAGSAAGS